MKVVNFKKCKFKYFSYSIHMTTTAENYQKKSLARGEELASRHFTQPP
jgi:hypothetical protein